MRFAATLLLVVSPAIACAAPPARPATGAAAEAIRKGMASGAKAFDHSAWDGLVSRLVDAQGRVDYAGFGRERTALEVYLGSLARAELASLSRGELLALLINAYNACTVRLILDGARDGRLPASIRDIADAWGRKLCTVGGETLSLDTIEHGLIRALFRDSRIHAAVNCASKSCPALQAWAFRGDRIDAQLQDVMQAMVGADLHVRVEDGRLRVSRIFDWYKSDFVDPSFQPHAASVPQYLLAFAGPERKQRIEALGPEPPLTHLDYDWSLNGR